MEDVANGAGLPVLCGLLAVLHSMVSFCCSVRTEARVFVVEYFNNSLRFVDD